MAKGDACSFCDKERREVGHLIKRYEGGPLICDECISLSLEMTFKHLRRLQDQIRELERDLNTVRAGRKETSDRLVQVQNENTRLKTEVMQKSAAVAQLETAQAQIARLKSDLAGHEMRHGALVSRAEEAYKENAKLHKANAPLQDCLREAIAFAGEILYGDFMPDPGQVERWRKAVGVTIIDDHVDNEALDTPEKRKDLVDWYAKIKEGI